MSMQGLQRFAVAASVALAVTSATTAVHAATLVKFAEFDQQALADPNVVWSNPGNTDNGDFYTADNGGKPSSVAVDFKFVNNALLASAGTIAANLTIAGGTTTTAATTVPIVDQSNVSGSFIITSVAGFFVGITHYSAGTILLSGNWTKGDIAGKGTSGAASASTLTSSVINFSSGVAGAVSGKIPRDLVLNLDAIAPMLTAAPGKALQTFKANADGAFAQAVPEPATWVMMMVGVGAIGAASRRRRQLGSAAA